MPPMKVGYVLPIADEGDGAYPWERIAGLARRAEAGGVDSLWVFDHLIFRGDGEEAGQHEAWTAMTAVAAVTSRADVGSLVFATSFRNPALLAKMAATLDDIAGGRLILGLGCGWNEPEYRAFGFPFDHRVGRFEEAIGVILPLLRGERVTFAGRWTEVDDCVLLPAPAHPIPILIAARRDRMLRLAARHAAAWNTAWFGLPDERFRERRRDLLAACEAEGRDPATVEQTVGIEVHDGTPPTPGPATPIPADPSAIADGLATWAAEGIAHVQVNVGPADERRLDLLLEGLQRFRG